MRTSTATVQANMIQTVKMHSKEKPFGAYFATRLEGVNNKLVCSLSLTNGNYCMNCNNTCTDDK